MSNLDFSVYRAQEIDMKLQRLHVRPLDIMVTGVTGAGKSTTLNTFFQKTVARVGDGVDPETMTAEAYRLNDWFRLWDTPGLGDNVETDRQHKKKIIDLLYYTYPFHGEDYGFIDLVLVVIEGANRDMGTTYDLLNSVIVPNIQTSRILVVINQADMAMKGWHWDHTANKPDDVLLSFLEEQAQSIQRRVREATGISILKPVYYSAKYGWNVQAVFDFIIKNIPNQRRPL